MTKGIRFTKNRGLLDALFILNLYIQIYWSSVKDIFMSIDVDFIQNIGWKLESIFMKSMSCSHILQIRH
jgi:hypothetical protein